MLEDRIRDLLEDIYIEGMGHTKGFDRERKITITQATSAILQAVREEEVTNPHQKGTIAYTAFEQAIAQFKTNLSKG